MHFSSWNRCVVFLVVVASLWMPGPVLASDPGDGVLYQSGITAFEQKDYASSTKSMLLLLQRYPDTPLRDVALFWLARGSFRIGDKKQAALYMSIFCREYPDSPLKDAAEEELLSLARAQEPGEELVLPPREVEAELKQRLAAEKATTEESHRAALERSADEKKSVSSDADREAAGKAAAAKITRVREALKKRSEEKQQLPKNEECKNPI